MQNTCNVRNSQKIIYLCTCDFFNRLNCFEIYYLDKLRTWHGERSIAEYTMIGSRDNECGNGCTDETGMFDSNSNSFYHAERIKRMPVTDNVCTSGMLCDHTNECEQSGVTITFQELIEYVDLRLITREDCCPHRYKNLCLYADDSKISCTPSDFVPSQGSEINFKDYNHDGSLSDEQDTEIYAKEFKLEWALPQCAQIAELYIDYKGKWKTFQNIFTSANVHLLPLLYRDNTSNFCVLIDFRILLS